MAQINKVKLPNGTTYDIVPSASDITVKSKLYFEAVNEDNVTYKKLVAEYVPPDPEDIDTAGTLTVYDLGGNTMFTMDMNGNRFNLLRVVNTLIAGTLRANNLTANRILVSDANKNIVSSDYGIGDFLLAQKKTSLDANSVSSTEFDIVINAITNAPTQSHASLLTVTDVGTPFQMFFPDNDLYVYKRYKLSNVWHDWTKMYAGYADTAGSAQPIFNNSTWYTVGDDIRIGDRNVGGCLCLQGLTSDITGLYFLSQNGSYGKKLYLANNGNFYIEGKYIISGYDQSGFSYGVSGIGKIADSNNFYATSDGGNYYWGVAAWSDKRLKKNIKDSKVNALELINKIQLKEFDFIDNKFGRHESIGYVAQDLLDVIPEAVQSIPLSKEEDKQKYGADKLFMVEDKYLTKYLVKAVQELTDIVDKQQQQIEELKNRVVALKEVVEY